MEVILLVGVVMVELEKNIVKVEIEEIEHGLSK